MAYSDFKDLPKRTASNKILRDKAFNIAKNPKDGYQYRLASMVYKFFDKKSSGSNTFDAAIEIKIISNQQVAETLHEPIIRKFEKQKVH